MPQQRSAAKPALFRAHTRVLTDFLRSGCLSGGYPPNASITLTSSAGSDSCPGAMRSYANVTALYGSQPARTPFPVGCTSVLLSVYRIPHNLSIPVPLGQNSVPEKKAPAPRLCESPRKSEPTIIVKIMSQGHILLRFFVFPATFSSVLDEKSRPW